MAKRLRKELARPGTALRRWERDRYAHLRWRDDDPARVELNDLGRKLYLRALEHLSVLRRCGRKVGERNEVVPATQRDVPSNESTQGPVELPQCSRLRRQVEVDVLSAEPFAFLEDEDPLPVDHALHCANCGARSDMVKLENGVAPRHGRGTVQGSSPFAQRNPRSGSRLTGAVLLRYADRRCIGLSFQRRHGRIASGAGTASGAANTARYPSAGASDRKSICR